MYATVHAQRAELTDLFRKVIKAAAGGGVAQGASQGLLTRIGLAALGNIKQAFVVKSRGGTDDCGDSWKKLLPSTIAYNRRHPGVLWPGKKRAPFRPSWMLTDKQRKRWWELNYRGGAAFAWFVLKSEGAKTLIGEYGDTPVDILRDTGLLLNSLSPGVPGSVPNQVFDLGAGSVTVGTNRKWAAKQHRTRPLWPDPSKWTDRWWASILDVAQEGLVEIMVFLLRNKS